MRTYRRRRAAGRLVLPIEVSEVDLSIALTEAGLIDPNFSDEPARLREGLERLVKIVTSEGALRVTTRDVEDH